MPMVDCRGRFGADATSRFCRRRRPEGRRVIPPIVQPIVRNASFSVSGNRGVIAAIDFHRVKVWIIESLASVNSPSSER